ncbi:MAG: zinc-ribbon domain-containing protein [Deltaproteobacteria bacterium]|nr:zinc-ribbon domain-containing protein [Deltaproteobacteria bacterium]
MEVTCDQCEGRFKVPDEKLPKGQKVRMGCPRCKNKIVIDLSRASADEETSSGNKRQLRQGGASGSTPDEGYGYEEYAEDKDLDFFEGDTKLALVMVEAGAVSQKIKRAVEKLGYRFISTPGTRDAIGKMRFHHFDLVILSDGFDGHELKNSPVINYLNRLSMSVRRRIFLALISDEFKTLDNMMAYAMSANVVINSKDIDPIQAILRKAILDHERFYKVFMDTMVEVGKA